MTQSCEKLLNQVKSVPSLLPFLNQDRDWWIERTTLEDDGTRDLVEGTLEETLLYFQRSKQFLKEAYQLCPDWHKPHLVLMHGKIR